MADFSIFQLNFHVLLLSYKQIKTGSKLPSISALSEVEGGALSEVEGGALSEVESGALSEVERDSARTLCPFDFAQGTFN